MNISQHLFVPLCQYEISNKVIRGDGTEVVSVASKTFRRSAPINDLTYMDLDKINSMQIFAIPVSGYFSASWYKNPSLPYGQAVFPSSSQVAEAQSKPLTLVSNLIVGHGTGSDCYFNSDDPSNSSNVLSIYWYEPEPAVSSLSMSFGNSFSPDVLDDEEYLI